MNIQRKCHVDDSVKKNKSDAVIQAPACLLKFSRVFLGFTLIELLVVIFIISIVSSVAILSLHHNQDKQLTNFTQELVQIMTLAKEQALLQPMTLGITINKNKQLIDFSSFEHALDESEFNWKPLIDNVLHAQIIPAQIEVRLKKTEKIAQENKTQQPNIVISRNGDITPFTIYVSQKGKAPRYAIVGEADGHISYQLLS